ncbi:glycoside hydrolase family 2 protein [Baudoinia panamericana UAMH 10762]|uniref:Glycoside hydrolase family 2 protein n=1 Tax=Baudoinia panamericana (strain UAMH 10762) TaxID=717646 RepID=M2N366_BAUPA|nr:glycoside hydrolase family 2 protein [Baudoinia panamericana UAMH 10762]EMC93135.1 glycoside hydrolase family 2 protein [Baudoinia panamericana UAMH 10762]
MEGYPRPDFQRSDLHWESLNGPWDFVFDDKDVGLHDGWQQSGISRKSDKRTIHVPYVFQCSASGIHERGVHEVLWYERQIQDLRSAAQRQRGDRLLVRFGAADYEAKIWLDGQYVGEHQGGHVPFDIDLTEAVAFSGSTKSHRLTVRVFDSASDLSQPRGKQFWGPQSESIFYTPSSGIWQSVWLESVPRLRIADSSHGTTILSHNVDLGAIDARIAVQGRRTQVKCMIELEIRLAGILVSRSDRREVPRDEAFVQFNHNMRLSPEPPDLPPLELTRETALLGDRTFWRNGIALWSPEHPTLYDLTIRLFDSDNTLLDIVHTTTGMRSLTWNRGDGTFRLNNRPYFQALLLDQGYWPDTLMTPPSQDALKQDILLQKSLGFNGCRKHQKVEDPAFLYWADKLGFLVWGEMASCHNFSVTGCERFEKEWLESVKRDINHPSLVCWTPVNESWGYGELEKNARQRDHLRSLYYQTRFLDPSRPVNDNCGWEHVVTDLSTFHDYADAKGMAERCTDLQSIFARGRGMFLPPLHGPSPGKEDPGSRHVKGAPVMCTEFGGVNVDVAGRNDEGRKGNWGYSTATDGKDLLGRFEELMMAVVREGDVCGVVWTQFADVEQEANGLVTAERVPKMEVEACRMVVEKVKGRYFGRLRAFG